MTAEMGRMGVGRYLMPLGVAYTGLAGLFSYLYPQVFRIPLPYWVSAAAGSLLLGAVGGYVSFKMLIGRGYDFMASKFGRDYGDYRAGVNEFFPWPYNRGKGEAS